MESKGLLMIGAVLVGGFFALTTLKDMSVDVPAAAATSLTGKPLRSDRETRAEGAPADYLVERAWGTIAEGPVASHDRSRAVFIGDAFADWRPADEDEVVGKIQLILNRIDCTMTPPEAGAYVVNLRVEHSETKSGLYTFGEAELREGVKNWFRDIQWAREGEPAELPGPRKSHEFRVHDIAVTETTRPVHLVLQNPTSSNILYNFHLAPGARVSGVSMLGAEANAAANLPEGVPVEVMNTATLSACGTPLVDRARGEGGIERRIRDHQLRGEDDIAEARAKLEADLEAFNGWFEALFGKRSDESLKGLSYAEASLIGPASADPAGGVAYRALAGAYVVAQTDAYFKVAGLHAWPGAFKEEVRRLGTELAGGDPLTIVRPARMTREY